MPQKKHTELFPGGFLMKLPPEAYENLKKIQKMTGGKSPEETLQKLLEMYTEAPPGAIKVGKAGRG